jgi:hypothetical protein
MKASFSKVASVQADLISPNHFAVGNNADFIEPCHLNQEDESSFNKEQIEGNKIFCREDFEAI